MDNFNWGVRRPSLSHLDGGGSGGAGSGLDGDLSSAQESFNEVTPVLPKRETNAGVGAEESSDDEMGSITVIVVEGSLMTSSIGLKFQHSLLFNA